jgi:hypothetical protein
MTAPKSRSGTLPLDLSTFLTHLSVALHKYRAYPTGHPMRSDARTAILAQLASTLETRPMLRIGVARRHLLIGDYASDPSNAVLGELAERLHRRQIGAILIRKGVGPEELEIALERLNADPRRAGGTIDPSEPERIGEFLELHPMSYTHLALAGEGENAPRPDSPDQLWGELARLTATPGTGLGGGGAQAMSEGLLSSGTDPATRAAVREALERFGRAAARDTGARGGVARRELRALMAGFSREELASILGIDVNRADGTDRLIEASEWMAVPAMVDLIESASASSGQNVSHFLLRLLRKLGGGDTPAVDGAGERDNGTRDVIQSLLRGWNLDDPNPLIHTRLLENLSRRERTGASPDAAYMAESERVVRVALEVGAAGQLVIEAVDGMLSEGQLGLLLDLIEAPGAEVAAPAIWAHLTTPATLRRVLLDEPVDHNACTRLLARVTLESAEGLLDSLAISESQETRWLILRRLPELGEGVGPLLVTRLETAPLYLRRNLLGLLADLPDVPGGFTARGYADDPEPLIRLEALRLMVQSSRDRKDAIHRALNDPDDRIVRIGIEAGIEHGLPKVSLPRLMKVLNDPSRPAELRGRGVAVLGQFATPTVRQWLVKQVLVRRGVFRRTRLASKSPDLVAGIGVLAKAFPGHPETVEILRLAAQSGDAELIGAGGGQRK